MTEEKTIKVAKIEQPQEVEYKTASEIFEKQIQIFHKNIVKCWRFDPLDEDQIKYLCGDPKRCPRGIPDDSLDGVVCRECEQATNFAKGRFSVGFVCPYADDLMYGRK